MYYKCENCVNRYNCPENQTQYRKLCKAIDKLTKKKKYHSYYSLTIKCDYWIADVQLNNWINLINKEENFVKCTKQRSLKNET